MIVLGVDPGLTRCGVGVIEAGAYRRLSFIHVDVVRSDPHESQDLRLLKIYDGLCAKMDEFIPDTVSIERVFAQENRNTVLGTAQAAGMAMLAAAGDFGSLSAAAKDMIQYEKIVEPEAELSRRYDEIYRRFEAELNLVRQNGRNQ